MALIRKGWAKPTDKIYSTGLVVAGRKVPIGGKAPPEIDPEESNRLSAEERAQIRVYHNPFDGPEPGKKGDKPPTSVKKPKVSKKK